MKIKTTLAIAALAVLLTACGKDEVQTPAAAPTPAPAAPTGMTKLESDIFLSDGDFHRNSVIGKSGKTCEATCVEQKDLASCKAAIIADGCVESRDAWRKEHPNFAGFDKPESQ